MIQATRVKHHVLLASQTVTDGATVTANLDMKGADYATIIINLGTEETTDATTAVISVLSSDDTVVSNFATIVANRSEATVDPHQVVYNIDTKTAKRYLRLSFTAGTGTGSNQLISANAITSRLGQEPSATSDMVASTNDAVVTV